MPARPNRCLSASSPSRRILSSVRCIRMLLQPVNRVFDFYPKFLPQPPPTPKQAIIAGQQHVGFRPGGPSRFEVGDTMTVARTSTVRPSMRLSRRNGTGSEPN